MKRMSFWSSLVCLILTGICSACSNEDDPVVQLMDPQEMFNNNQWYPQDQTVLRWNEETVQARVGFLPTKEDTTQLEMVVSGMKPGRLETHGQLWTIHYLAVPIETMPGESEIHFNGQETTSEYDLSIQGVYTEKSVDIQCVYKVTGGIQTEIPYVLLLDKEHVQWKYDNWSGTVEWDGQTYTKTYFARQTWEKIIGRMSQEVTAVQMLFHANGYLDMALQYASETDFTPWMTVRYWYTEDHQMCWELTYEQENQFYDQWTGHPSIYLSPFLPYSNSESQLLYFEYETADSYLSFNVHPFVEDDLLLMYMKAKGLEGLTEKEQEELALLGTLIRGMDNDTDYIVYYPPIIQMKADKVE